SPDPKEVYIVASRLIFAHRVHPGQPKLTGEIEAKVRQAVADLEVIVKDFPDAWSAHYFLGMGKRSLGELEAAYEAMRRAYELEKDEESVPREFAGSCFEWGRANEAVEVGERAAALKPDNHETLGNRACAYLIAGRIQEAAATIDASLKINATDSVNRHLQ